jgi:hypothetical protein
MTRLGFAVAAVATASLLSAGCGGTSSGPHAIPTPTVQAFGWTPPESIAAAGSLVAVAASDNGKLLAAIHSPGDYGPRRVLVRDTQWTELPRTPADVVTLAFDDEDPIAVVDLEESQTASDGLYLARLQSPTAWSLPTRLFAHHEGVEFHQAHVLLSGGRTYAAAVDAEPFICGITDESLLATACDRRGCGAPSVLVPTQDSQGEGFSVGLVASPEGPASVLYSDAESADPLIERSVSTGTEVSRVRAGSFFTPRLRAVSVGSTLFVVDVQYTAQGEGFFVGSRQRDSAVWSTSLAAAAALDTGSVVSACAVAGVVRLVWDGPSRTSQRAVWTARLFEGHATATSQVPGSQASDFISGVHAVCTDTELHVLWSTDAGGVVHTALGPF